MNEMSPSYTVVGVSIYMYIKLQKLDSLLFSFPVNGKILAERVRIWCLGCWLDARLNLLCHLDMKGHAPQHNSNLFQKLGSLKTTFHQVWCLLLVFFVVVVWFWLVGLVVLFVVLFVCLFSI